MKNFLTALHTQFLEITKKVPLQLIVFGQTLLIIILIILVPAIYLNIRNSRNNNSKASTPTGTASISLSPTSSALTPNTHQSVDVMVNTGQERVDGIQAIMTFSDNVPADLTFTPSTISGLNNIVNTTELIGSNKKISLAFITSNPQQPFTTNSALIKVGTLSFSVPATGKMLVSFDQQMTTAIRNGTAEDILKTPEDATYLFALSANQSEPSLSFDTLTPPNPQQVGSNWSVNIVADTALQQVSGIDAQISFDPSTVEIISIEEGDGTPFLSYPELTYDNTAGKIYVSANIGTAASPQPVMGSGISVAKIAGRTKIATTSTTLQFVFNPNDRNDSNLVLHLDQRGQEPIDILAKVTNQQIVAMNPNVTTTPGISPSPTLLPTATPTVTLTPIPTQTAPNNITLELALQGKSRPEADKTMQLSIQANSVDNLQTISDTLTTNSAGQAQLTAVPNDYVLLVKAPGYLARKMGSATDPIRLVGTTPVNLTSTPLLGGDFNSDDEINSIDYTLHFLTSFRNTNPVVDLDSSGNVNNLDFAIMRSNWALHSDTL